MAGEADETLELTDEQVTNPENQEEQQPDIPSFEDDGDGGEGETNLVRHLRAELKERNRLLKEAQAKIPQSEPDLVKPDLWGDFNGDTDAYDAAYAEYLDAKRGRESQQQTVAQQREEAQKVYAQRVEQHVSGIRSLGHEDAEDMDALVSETLNPWQREVLVKYTGNSPALTYALGKNPAKLAELAQQQDVIEFGHAIKMLEGKMTMAKRRAPTDKAVNGSNMLDNSSWDERIAKAEKRAEQTQDRSEVIRLKRQKREAEKA